MDVLIVVEMCGGIDKGVYNIDGGCMQLEGLEVEVVCFFEIILEAQRTIRHFRVSSEIAKDHTP